MAVLLKNPAIAPDAAEQTISLLGEIWKIEKLIFKVDFKKAL